MVTVKDLRRMLSVYPDDMPVTTEQLEDIVHIKNVGDTVILSPVKPIGTCNRTGSPVYPSRVGNYTGFCPELNEDLFNFEWTKGWPK
jgi:hypothetical protein